jgi:NodT family efflux transporter outer membrane factor (OMF) lipoprotein
MNGRVRRLITGALGLALWRGAERRRPAPAPSLSAVMALVCGCAAGPDYEAPTLDLPAAWSRTLEEGLAGGAAVEERWWKLFDDPVLDAFIERARSRNLSVQEAVARIHEARAQRGVVRGGLLPEGGAVGSYTRIDISDNGNPFGSGDGDFPAYDFWSAGFDASWELDVFGRVRRALEAAGAEIDGAVEGMHGVVVTLLGDVAANYVQIRTLEERIRSAEENARIQAETLRITEERYRAGAVSQLDVSQAKSNLHRTLAAVPLLQGALARTMNRLRVLMGESPRDLSEELAGPRAIPAAKPRSIALGVPAELLRRRPDVRQAERDLSAQSARIGVAAADLYPRLSLVGTFTLDSTEFDPWLESDSTAFRAGPSLRWNVFNFGRARSTVHAREARFEQALHRYRQIVLEAIEEVENALVSYARNREAEAHLAQAREAAEQAAETADVQYRQGATSFQSLLDAQRFLAEVEDLHAASRGDVTLSLIALFKALGGGWSAAGPAAGSDEAGGAARLSDAAARR